MQTKRSSASRPPFFSVARFGKKGFATTFTIIILAIGILGLLTLLWLEFTNPALLDRQRRDSQLRPSLSEVRMAIFSPRDLNLSHCHNDTSWYRV
jgi:hypothetical protein